MNIFGLTISRKKSDSTPTVVTPFNEDGSTIVTGAAGGYYAQVLELEARIKNENDLIRRYREIALYPDCDSAIDDIVNEAIVAEEDSPVVTLCLDDLKVSDQIKETITEEFDNIIRLLKFNAKGHDYFRSWYIDGRIYFHVVVDEKNIQDGIKELRPIDPRKIRKIKTVKKIRQPTGVETVQDVDEYYLYNDKGITETTMQGVKLPLDAVIYSPSGLVDANTSITLSYLHRSIKIVNQLKMMEDAVVIYRISRAPERRIFYIDVGNLPKIKAEQYVTDIMNKFRNKIVYDASTGEVKGNKNQLSMMEDFWLPRRDSGKSTEITTLPGGQQLSQIGDIEWFQNKLFQSLNVPLSRLKGDTPFSFGKSQEITRDEIKFNKFVQRIRKKFSNIFSDALRVQLILKNIITPDEWDNIEQFIKFNFQRDNYYSSLKENELLNTRIATLQQIDPFVGKYFSIEWVKKHVLEQTDQEIEKIENDLEIDRENELEIAKHQGQVEAIKNQPMMDQQNNE